MGKVIADALDGELDVVLVRKLGAPGNPELAIGSIDETGQVLLGDYARTLGISERYIEAEKEAQLNTLQKRRAEYTPVRPPIDPANRIVIVVDDGVATGSTMLAALRALRAKGPARLIAAMGVAPADTAQRLESEADEVVCLYAPSLFYAVGQFFQEFLQVSDEEVIALLQAPRGAEAP
jgi:predicted phosphoribosyltransferase